MRFRLAHAALSGLLLSAAYNLVERRQVLLDLALADPTLGYPTGARLYSVGRVEEAQQIGRALISRPTTLLAFDSLSWIQSSLFQMQRLNLAPPDDLGDHLVATGPSRTRLVAIALQTPLHFLASFLGCADKTPKLRPVFEALAEALAREEHRTRLVAIALQTPLHFLASFLGYAGKKREMRPAFETLAGSLSAEEANIKLAQNICCERIDAIVSIFRAGVASDVWKRALLRVDLSGWDEGQGLVLLQKIDAFVSFQRIAAQLQREELAFAPASRIVEASQQSDWTRSGIGIHHLSHVLRLAKQTTLAQRKEFLGRVVTSEWLDANYESANAGGLAGALLGMATILPPDDRLPFVRPRLTARLRAELFWSRDTVARTGAFALLGATSLIAIEGRFDGVIWPSETELAEIVTTLAPTPERETIGPLQVHLWLGLRQMARVLSTPCAVPAFVADRVLVLWEASQERADDLGTPNWVIEVNRGMIAWLRSCKSAGWRLVPP